MSGTEYRALLVARILELAPTLKGYDPSWPMPDEFYLGAYTNEGLVDLGKRIVTRIERHKQEQGHEADPHSGQRDSRGDQERDAAE